MYVSAADSTEQRWKVWTHKRQAFLAQFAPDATASIGRSPIPTRLVH